MGPFSLTDGASSPGMLVRRRRVEEDSEFDMTAMVDLVFMMNIYFLVTFLTAAMGEVDLPTATVVSPLDAESAVVVTIKEGPNDDRVALLLGDDETPLTDKAEQDKAVRAAVASGAEAGKEGVLIKAEKHVCLRELFRIMTAAYVEGMPQHVAVLEVEASR
ncbi:MAG: ExbD/TolR family protein [Lacipirellulaceae bacterium]